MAAFANAGGASSLCKVTAARGIPPGGLSRWSDGSHAFVPRRFSPEATLRLSDRLASAWTGAVRFPAEGLGWR